MLPYQFFAAVLSEPWRHFQIPWDLRSRRCLSRNRPLRRRPPLFDRIDAQTRSIRKSPNNLFPAYPRIPSNFPKRIFRAGFASIPALLDFPIADRYNVSMIISHVLFGVWVPSINANRVHHLEKGG